MAFLALPDAPEWEALRLSLLVAALAVAIALPFAVASAWIVSRSRAPGRGVVNALIHLPLVLPPIVIGYLPLRSPRRARPDRAPLFHPVRLAHGLHHEGGGDRDRRDDPAHHGVLDAARARRGRPGLEAAARTLGASRADASRASPCRSGARRARSGGDRLHGRAWRIRRGIVFAAASKAKRAPLPLAIYTALQVPGGESAQRASPSTSIVLALLGLALERMAQRALALKLESRVIRRSRRARLVGPGADGVEASHRYPRQAR